MSKIEFVELYSTRYAFSITGDAFNGPDGAWAECHSYDIEYSSLNPLLKKFGISTFDDMDICSLPIHQPGLEVIEVVNIDGCETDKGLTLEIQWKDGTIAKYSYRGDYFIYWKNEE